ncbi:MAG: hypothetical protein GF355_05870 [Candidatus Eisenbacteria bacterium]|nr:hypothetical protein [Candidatus Eisenbacteria bacterium]
MTERRSNRIWNRLGIVSAAVAMLIAAGSVSRAADTGTLKLKVSDCGEAWLDDAKVEIDIVRSGSGTVADTTVYSDSLGYVEVTFTILENEDEAQVTVTPDGSGNSDSGHVYEFVSDGRGGGVFDVEDLLEGACRDYWYDEENNIIQCNYDG